MSALATNGASTKTAQKAVPKLGYGAEQPADHGAGWILFATIMFAIAATLNVIWGIAAVSGSHFFVGNAHYILSDLNTWGWIAMGFGAVEALASISIWLGGAFGRWFGIVVAGLGCVMAMLTIPAYPFWSLTLVALSVLVVYGLAAYGGKPELTR